MQSKGIVTPDRSKALQVLGSTQTASQAYLKRLPDGRWLAHLVRKEEENP